MNGVIHCPHMEFLIKEEKASDKSDLELALSYAG